MPEPLVGQWKRELGNRLHVDEFGDRVRILPFDALSDIDVHACDILVVDEAHQLVLAGDVSPGGTAASGPYQKLVALAQESRGLLLLSAIPVVGNELAMLRMLHLLDPIVHRLDRPEELRRKVERQDEIAGYLLRLDPDSGLPPEMLQVDVKEIAASIPDDPTVQEIARYAAGPDADIDLCVRQLHDHLAEAYRLHHRLVRTRRADLELQGEGTVYSLLPRKGELTVVVDHDPMLAAFRAELEEWRITSRADSTVSEADRKLLASRLSALVEAYGRGSVELAAELRRQREGLRQRCLPTFVGEVDVIASIVRQFQNYERSGERNVRYLTTAGWRHARLPGPHRVLAAVTAISALLEAIQLDGQRTSRVVAFSSSTTFARTLAAGLRQIMGDAAVSTVLDGDSHELVDEAIRAFAAARSPAVLICDRAGEHGLNLQFAHGIVHLDLPLSPTRIEQRIGRVDRFGRQTPTIRQAVVVSDDTAGMWSGGWLQTLRDGLKVFDRPVSDVQFLLEQLEPEFRRQLYEVGPAVFVTLAETLPGRLEAARNELESQYLLNRAAYGQSGGQALAEAIQAAESHEVDLETRVDDWIRNVVGLQQTVAMTSQGWRRYAWSPTVSLPGHGWERWLAPALARRWTYRREVSLADSGAHLVRPGSELLRCLEPLFDDHDEGRTFGIWRYAPSAGILAGDVQLVFRVVFRVQARIGEVGGTPLEGDAAREHASLQRRADRYLPPSVEAVYLSSDLTRVLDPHLLEILSWPWSAKTRADEGRDFLFGSHPEMLERVMDMGRFAELCNRLPGQAERELYKDEAFRARLNNAADRADADLKRRTLALERRQIALKRSTGRRDLTVQIELEALQQIVGALQAPAIDLDVAGVILIAGHPPGASS